MNSILTVTSAASSYDLTLLATVKAEFGLTNTSEDIKIRRWITQASKAIAGHCNRVFAQETVTETFWPGQCEINVRTLVLSRRPIASVTSVTLDDEVVDASEYRIGAAAGLLHRLDSSGYPSLWCAGKSIIVAYVGGYELLVTLPEEIERAAIMLVRDMRADTKRDPNLKRVETAGIGAREYWVPPTADSAISAEAAELLRPYRNIAVG